MNRLLKWMGSAMLIAVSVMIVPAQKADAQPGVSVSFQTFYDQLSPYGQWIDNPSYGYVWTPRGVGNDFRPYYSGGQWAMTNYGNTWVSEYPWGWAPFHYGRWAYDPFYGWMWVPGNEWGPAWVSWRGGGEYYGWAPMGPNISINVSFGPQYAPPMDWWVFVPCNRIYHHGGYHHYWRGPGHNNTYYNNTTIINNTYINNNYTYVSGPGRSDIERRLGQKVNVYNVRNDNAPRRSDLRGNTLNIYRPEVRQARNSNERPQNALRAERPSNDNNTVHGRSNTGMNADGERAAGRNSRIAQPGNNDAVSSNRLRGNEAVTSGRNDDNRMVQEREQANRQREIQANMQRQNEERISRQRETEQANRQREMQVNMQRQNEERISRQREIESARNRQESQDRIQAQAERQQRDAQRAQQQRAVEQRAQQQQQIESRRQQHFENQQRQPNSDRGGSQRVERSAPAQREQPQATQRNGNADDGSVRRR